MNHNAKQEQLAALLRRHLTGVEIGSRIPETDEADPVYTRAAEQLCDFLAEALQDDVMLIPREGPQALTKRQRELLDYLAAMIRANRYAPSLEEIAYDMGLTSLATVHKHLTNLERKGYIRRQWNRSRSIQIVSNPTAVVHGRRVALSPEAA